MWCLAGFVEKNDLPHEVSFFAVPGSAYGSLAARQMKYSLYSYWHKGESAYAPAIVDDGANKPPPPGRFKRSGSAKPNEDLLEPRVEKATWHERLMQTLLALESRRTRGNTQFNISPAHQRYLDASAIWRLQLACALDPGDPVLYEILNLALSTKQAHSETVRLQLLALVDRAIKKSSSPQAGMLDQLTAIGAAIDRLNELQSPELKTKDEAAIRYYWDVVQKGLGRYETIRKQADDEGWWDGISMVRQQEIESHAGLLKRIASGIGKIVNPAKAKGMEPHN